MTIRMGLALGLHAESNRFDPVEQYTRRHIWFVLPGFDFPFVSTNDLGF